MQNSLVNCYSISGIRSFAQSIIFFPWVAIPQEKNILECVNKRKMVSKHQICMSWLQKGKREQLTFGHTVILTTSTQDSNILSPKVSILCPPTKRCRDRWSGPNHCSACLSSFLTCFLSSLSYPSICLLLNFSFLILCLKNNCLPF